MAQKSTLNINFSQGLDTKTDAWQVALGKFELLQNSIFQKGGLLQKRNGYGLLTDSTPPNSSSYLSTLNDNLVAIGNTVNAYSSSLGSWITQGQLEPCSLDVLPLIRNNLNQTQSDTAISNGLILTTYSQLNNATTTYFYAIADAISGQNIVAPTAIMPITSGAISGSSRAFVVGNFFLIVSQVLVSGTTFLQYIAIPIMNPSNPGLPAQVTAEAYVPISANPGWDAVSAEETLVIAYNTTAGGQSVHVATLTQGQIGANTTSATIRAFTNAAYKASLLSIAVDTTNTTTNYFVYYISFYNSTTTNGYTFAVYIGLGSITTQFNPQQIITATVTDNIASVAHNGFVLIYNEVENNYAYDSGVPTHYINNNAVTSAGVVGGVTTIIRSVGLASKAFMVDGTAYFLAGYKSPYQPTYFLINASTTTVTHPVIVAKLAYENGVGYVTLGLPSVTVTDNVAQISYLYKDLVAALATLDNSQQTTSGGIYSQLGVNLVSFTLGTDKIDTAEIAQNLHISGGYLSMYDAYLPVEHNFFLWPDSVEVTGSTTGGVMTAQQYFYQVTYEWTDNNGLAYRSAPSIPVSVTTTGSTSSVTVNVPTLRLTAKTANPVKIVIYRWSTANQTYFQVTSITAPTLNSTSSDAIAYVDTLADSSVVGNDIIYTTGGVVEDVNAPATDIVTLFDTRLWLVDSEDRNLLWVSKQVIENTPVEMSDLFTIYVAPNIGTVASSGPITALFPMDDKICIFKKDAIYYINGVGPNDLGTTAVGCSLGNYSQPTFITSVVGCTNQKSLVLTQNGLMFQSDKGIWILNRSLQVSYIGAAVESFNTSLVTSANVIPETNYVVFTLNTGEMLMYDYYYQQWGTFIGASAVSSCIYKGLHTLLTPYGQILQETPGAYLDNANPVLLKFTTSWINLASLQGYERFYNFYILAKYLSPHQLLCQVAYDYNYSILHQKLISPNNFSSAVPGPFGIPTPFGSPGDKEQWKIDAKRQLCEAFQLSITEVFDASFDTMAGAGFTMSGLTCEVGIKKATRPIRGTNSAGMQ